VTFGPAALVCSAVSVTHRARTPAAKRDSTRRTATDDARPPCGRGLSIAAQIPDLRSTPGSRLRPTRVCCLHPHCARDETGALEKRGEGVLRGRHAVDLFEQHAARRLAARARAFDERPPR